MNRDASVIAQSTGIRPAPDQMIVARCDAGIDPFGDMNPTSAPTALDRFMRARGIRPLELARAAGCSRQSVLRARQGTAEPTRRAIAAILSGMREVTDDPTIQVSDLFDFDDGPLAARLPGESWRRIKPPGRPRKAREGGPSSG